MHIALVYLALISFVLEFGVRPGGGGNERKEPLQLAGEYSMEGR